MKICTQVPALWLTIWTLHDLEFDKIINYVHKETKGNNTFSDDTIRLFTKSQKNNECEIVLFLLVKQILIWYISKL